MKVDKGLNIASVEVIDVRFPTSIGNNGSDALHTDPNYSCAYVTIKTDNGCVGYGLTFTIGRGTEVVVLACKSMKQFILGKNAADIFNDFASFWRVLTSDSQMRWIGPEKGATHLAVAAIINALWDMWARIEDKPVWKLLADLTPEELVSTIDFRYITDVITPEEAILILHKMKDGKENRIKTLLDRGYPAYTTQVGWLGYSDDVVRTLTKKYLELGYDSFKVKVGISIEKDVQRCKLIRELIGYENNLMVDANQAWDVTTAIDWMNHLVEFKPMWIEEPTSPDDILGHTKIAVALRPKGIGVATGEMCANRVMFKQFMQAGAMDYCQIDSARIGGINEILAVYLMAYKLKVKVCPHAGGVGLCEMVQHLQMWDYISLSGTMDERLIEYVDQQHEHFVSPVVVEKAHYIAPKTPGYNTEFTKDTIEKYAYPYGKEWQRMFKSGIFPEPDEQ